MLSKKVVTHGVTFTVMQDSKDQKTSPHQFSNQIEFTQSMKSSKENSAGKTKDDKEITYMLSTGEIKYEFGRLLNSGMIGFAYIARSSHTLSEYPMLYCVKRMLGKLISEKNLFTPLKREIIILGKIQEIKGCVKLVDVLRDVDGLGLVMPYYPAGDLSRFIKTVRPRARCLPESVARTLFTQLVRTFQELHGAGIVHRDLKLENILVEVEDGRGQSDPSVIEKCPEKIKLYLSDFGFAITLKELHEQSAYQAVGTPTYLPYEMLTRTTANGKNGIYYTESVDIWCLGVLLYQILYATTPFMSEPFDREATKNLIRQLKYGFPKSP